MIIREILVDTWHEFIRWYLINCRRWNIIKDLLEQNKLDMYRVLNEAFGLYGVLWHEADLVLYFSYMLMDRFKEKSSEDLEIHINYRLKPQNFVRINNKVWSRKIDMAIEEMRRILGYKRKWYPEIDLIVTISREELPFKMCIEFKYYHYNPRLYRNISPSDEIKRKYIILNLLKKYKVTEDIGVIILDDYLNRNIEDQYHELEDLMREYSKQGVLAEIESVSYNELLNILNYRS